MHPSIETLKDLLTAPANRAELCTRAGTHRDVAAGLVLALMQSGHGWVNGSATPFDAANPTPQGTRHAADHFATYLERSADPTKFYYSIVSAIPHMNRMGGHANPAGIALAYIAANRETSGPDRAYWFGDAASEDAQRLATALEAHPFFRGFTARFDSISYDGMHLSAQDLRPITKQERDTAFRADLERRRRERYA